MCGIAGYTGKSTNQELIKMSKMMLHRGPDDDGFYENNSFHLCMRRLSIVDLELGKQPIYNSDRSVVVMFNGEIYNYIELTQELQNLGYKFSTNSDTETITHLYNEYGINFIHKLNGMFAICLLDTRTNSLYLIRDRIGEKPIYYFYDKGTKDLKFSSEFNVLNTDKSNHKINKDSLAWYFSQKAMPSSETINTDICKVPAGCYLHYKADKTIELVRYYKVAKDKVAVPANDSAVLEKLDDLIKDSIKLRMRADVEVGAFLSGGVDSSLIVSIASKYTPKPLKTYSLVYEDNINFKGEDKKYARIISDTYSTQHTEVLLSPQLLIEELPKIVKHYGQPNSAVLSNWFISKEMSKKVKVSLSGDGADELFGSYFLHRIAGRIANHKDTQNGKYLEMPSEKETEFLQQNINSPIHKLVDQFGVFTSNELEKLLNKELFSSKDILKMLKKKEDEIISNDLLNKTLEFDFNNLLVDQVLNYTDTLGMAHSLEIRTPYLDYRLIDFVFSLSHDFKIRDKETKFILKKLAEKYLPKDLIYRPKEGFVEPAIYWLQKEMKDFCLFNLKSSSFNKLNFLNKTYTDEVINSFYKTSDFYLGKKVWSLLMFSLWEKQYGN